jgi:hypothetical protein
VDAIEIILDTAADRRPQLYPVVPYTIQAAVIDEARKMLDAKHGASLDDAYKRLSLCERQL